jgi:hypothetical protein
METVYGKRLGTRGGSRVPGALNGRDYLRRIGPVAS